MNKSMNKESKNYPSYLDYPLEPKPITMGDKIREDNESLSAFIRGQFGDDRVFHNGGKFDLDEFLNQPYTNIEEVLNRR